MSIPIDVSPHSLKYFFGYFACRIELNYETSFLRVGRNRQEQQIVSVFSNRCAQDHLNISKVSKDIESAIS